MTIRLFLREFSMRSEVSYQEISSQVRRKVLHSGRHKGKASLVLHALEHPFAPIPFGQAPAVDLVLDLVFLTLYLLETRFGQISPSTLEQIQQLPLAQLEELGEALLDFDSMQDLTAWLQAHQV